MPVDPFHIPTNRRAARKLTVNDEETDLKRARGEISCAECRRLKLKCDKKIPCGSCARRGCPSICPKGSLSTGQGTRFVLADTTQLHEKISEMGQRIRQLEDALAIFQSGVSNECHPLLREELLSIKFGPETGYLPDKDTARRTPLEPPIDALGTMTIGDRGDRGEGKYFGPSAGSETLFLAGAELEQLTHEDEGVPPLSVDLVQISAFFPCGGYGNIENAFEFLFQHLPPEPRAWSLCETYLEQAAWSFRVIQRDELIGDFLSPIYKAVKEKGHSGEFGPQLISPHKFAVLFLVFALGALVDLTLEPFSKEAELYHHLGRCCLSLRSIIDSPEMSTVIAVLLMAHYHGMEGTRYTMDSSWSLMALGAKLAQGLGLHRDSARWKMDPKTVQRRRALFWEMFSSEQYYSLALGRPPSIRLSYVDCEFPNDDEATTDAMGNHLDGYYQWKYEFTKEILASVIELTLTAGAPQYQTILELDRKVREKPLPPHLNAFVDVGEENCTPSTYMRQCLLSQYRGITLLYLHRSFFAQALLDHSINPLQSPFAPSFLAAYRCASGVIKSSLKFYDSFPELCGRWWGIWTHLFSSAIIVGCIVTRSPSSSMASSAFIELGLACDLFEKGSMQSRRARSGLAILHKMREKAFHIYSQFRSGNSAHGVMMSPRNPDYNTDELALFGGQTPVLVSKLFNRSNQQRKPLPSSSPLDSNPSSIPDYPSDNNSEVDFSLMECLSRFNPSNMASEGWENWQTPSPYNLSLPPSEPHTSIISGPHLFTTSYSSLNQTVPVQEIDDQTGNSVVDLGMILTGEVGMDDQWMSFMRTSGLFGGDRCATGSTYYGSPGVACS